MTEIEQLYEKAGIEPLCQIPDGSCGLKNIYEDFTAEKQLELIKWLGEWDYTVRINFDENEWGIATENNSGYFQDNLSDALASIINDIWQSLTEQEQQQIKDILRR